MNDTAKALDPIRQRLTHLAKHGDVQDNTEVHSIVLQIVDRLGAYLDQLASSSQHWRPTADAFRKWKAPLHFYSDGDAYRTELTANLDSARDYDLFNGVYQIFIIVKHGHSVMHNASNDPRNETRHAAQEILDEYTRMIALLPSFDQLLPRSKQPDAKKSDALKPVPVKLSPNERAALGPIRRRLVHICEGNSTDPLQELREVSEQVLETTLPWIDVHASPCADTVARIRTWKETCLRYPTRSEGHQLIRSSAWEEVNGAICRWERSNVHDAIALQTVVRVYKIGLDTTVLISDMNYVLRRAYQMFVLCNMLPSIIPEFDAMVPETLPSDTTA